MKRNGRPIRRSDAHLAKAKKVLACLVFRSVQCCLEQINLLIRAGAPINSVGHAVEVRLEVEVQPGAIVVEDLQHLIYDLTSLVLRFRVADIFPTVEPARIIPVGVVGARSVMS